jgi:capping protein alpha
MLIVLQVQLATEHALSIALPSAVVTSSPPSSASKILALIEDEEGKYQTSLNDTYHEMGEKTFKGLRRALPMTRQKLDWDKASNRAHVPSDFFFLLIADL